LNFSLFTKEALNWSYSVTQIFGTDIFTGDGPRRYIIPLFPPRYHPKVVNQWEVVNDSSGISKVNCRWISREPSILSNFENKTNEELLVQLGMVVKNNPNDCININLSEYLTEYQVAKLERSEFGITCYIKKSCYPNRIINTFKEYLQIPNPKELLIHILEQQHTKKFIKKANEHKNR